MFQHGCSDLNSFSLISLPGLNPHVRDFPRVIFWVWSAKGLDPARPALGTPVSLGEGHLTSKTSHNDSGDRDGPAHDNFPDVVAACDDDAQRSQGEATAMVYFRKQVPSGLRILTKNVHVTVFKYLHMYVMDSEKKSQDFEGFIFRWWQNPP